MEYVKIIALTVLGAMAYGVVHDEVTIRICPEYFTVAHPHIFHTASLTLMAAGWGVAATWWLALILGALLAGAARAGKGNKVGWRRLVRPMLVVLVAMAAFAALAGYLGWWMTNTGRLTSAQPWALQIPFDEQRNFAADLFSHAASYLGGCLGGLTLLLWVMWQRYGPVSQAPRR